MFNFDSMHSHSTEVSLLETHLKLQSDAFSLLQLPKHGHCQAGEPPRTPDGTAQLHV